MTSNRLHSQEHGSDWETVLLGRWAALDSEEQSNLLLLTEPPAEGIAHALWNYARAIEQLVRLKTGDVSWIRICELADGNQELALAIKNVPQDVRDHLVGAALGHLGSRPANEWSNYFGPSRSPGGLSALRENSDSFLSIWAALARLEGVELKADVSLALFTLWHHSRNKFYSAVVGIHQPVPIGLIAAQYGTELEFGMRLAASDIPIVAAIGVRTSINHLRSRVMEAEVGIFEEDLFKIRSDLASMVERRRAILNEIHDSLRALLGALGGGPLRGQILGETIASALRETDAYLVSYACLTAGVAAGAVAESKNAGDDEFISAVVRGLRADPTHGMAGAEYIARSMLNQEVACRWRWLLLCHLAARCTLPPRETFEGQQDSQTDPLAPCAYATERAFIKSTAAALGQLSHECSFDVEEWFRAQFADLEVLGDRRDRPYGQWLQASSPRAAFLILIGVHLIQVCPRVRTILGRLLAEELTKRVDEWEWYKRVGYDASVLNLLELDAVRLCGETLQPAELLPAIQKARSVWTILQLSIRGTSADDLVRAALETHFDSDLFILDQSILLDIMWHLAERGRFQELKTAIARYHSTLNVPGLGWGRSFDVHVDIFEAVSTLQDEPTEGMRLLNNLRDRLEHRHDQSPQGLRTYIMVLRLCYLCSPNEGVFSDLKNIESAYDLVVTN